MQYKLTKVITLTPRFIFKNKLGGTINFRQEKSQSFVHLTPGEQAPLHELTKSASEPRVVIAYPGVNQEW
jgi:vacuolar protein sorting-associated protein 13A/C